VRLSVAALATTVIAAGLVPASSTPAAAVPTGMVLDCADGRHLTRSNGASFWGLTGSGVPDGSVYVGTHLRIVGLDGQLQHETRHRPQRPQASDTCVAQHGPFPDEGYEGSIWTVTLVRVT